ncbi:MAG: hypothetical protein ACM3PR_09065 [Bacteroidales bacterium]
MKNKLLFTAFLLLLSTMIFAQGKFGDRLIQRNGKVIVCQVREIGDDEIKYVMEGYRDDLVFGIDKNKVATIVFADGRQIELSDSMYGAENYAEQNKNAFKFYFFSPLFGASTFGYERSLSPGRSIEFSLGIIGLGNEKAIMKESDGFHFNIGYKFIKDPDFYLKGMRYAHILKGSYFKPELAFSSYSYTDKDFFYYNNETAFKGDVLMGAFILNVGKQWVYSDRFLIDWFVGAGYGFGSSSGDGSNSYHYGFSGGNKNFPMVFKGGIKIGLLF